MQPMSKAERAIFNTLPEIQRLVISERQWRASVEPSRIADEARGKLDGEREHIKGKAEVFRSRNPIRAWLHDKGLMRSNVLARASSFEEAYPAAVAKIGVSWRATGLACEVNAQCCREEIERLAFDPDVRAQVAQTQVWMDARQSVRVALDAKLRREQGAAAATVSDDGTPKGPAELLVTELLATATNPDSESDCEAPSYPAPGM